MIMDYKISFYYDTLATEQLKLDMVENKGLKGLSSDLEGIFNNMESADVTIVCNRNCPIYVHKSILCARSKVICVIFTEKKVST